MTRPFVNSSVACLTDLPEFVRSIAAVKVISFDIFDTLLWRQSSAATVGFQATGQLLESLSSRGYVLEPIDVLWNERKHFAKGREDHCRSTGVEWCIDEWFDWLAFEFDIDPDVVRSDGTQAELLAEQRSTFLAPAALQTIASLRQMNYELIGISDTFLSPTALSTLLSSKNIVLDHVFASTETRSSKRHGPLFDHVLQTLAREPAELLHIGDNWKADYVRPLQRGIRALWVPRPQRTSPLPGWLRRGVAPKLVEDAQRLVQSLEAPELAAGTHPMYRLGYQSLAPLLCISSLWQWRKFQELNITSALYLAREGELFKQAYDLLDEALPSSPTRHYVHLSRRAVSLAHPRDLLSGVEGLAGRSGKKYVGDFLDQFALPTDFVTSLLQDSKLTLTTVLTPNVRQKLRRTMAKLSSHIEELRRDNKTILQDYLKTFIGTELDERIALIDTGWGGTIQDTVRSALDESRFLAGLYLGVFSHGQAPTSHNEKAGLLFDEFKMAPWSGHLHRSAGILRLWEVLFSNMEGTTRALECDSVGRVVPRHETPCVRTAQQHALLQQLRAGAHEGVNARLDAVASIAACGPSWSSMTLELAASSIARELACRPDRAVAGFLLTLRYEENAAQGRLSSLDLRGIGAGVAWWPGILAYYGLGCLHTPLELFAQFMGQRQIEGRP